MRISILQKLLVRRLLFPRFLLVCILLLAHFRCSFGRDSLFVVPYIIVCRIALLISFNTHFPCAIGSVESADTTAGDPTVASDGLVQHSDPSSSMFSLSVLF